MRRFHTARKGELFGQLAEESPKEKIIEPVSTHAHTMTLMEWNHFPKRVNSFFNHSFSGSIQMESTMKDGITS